MCSVTKLRLGCEKRREFETWYISKESIFEVYCVGNDVVKIIRFLSWVRNLSEEICQFKMIEWYQAYSDFGRKYSFLSWYVNESWPSTQVCLALLFLIAGQAYHAIQTLPSTTARVWEVKSSHIERYMQECLSQPTIVHLATHG